MTAFYGMREYPELSVLKNHIDRIDTHVLSVTLSIAKFNTTEESQPWPLEVVQWNGDHVRYHHPAGTMVLYESSKLLHGRPFRNHGGVHLGAFLHFKPAGMHGQHKSEWDTIAKNAKADQTKNTQWMAWKSTASVEPTQAAFTDHNYGYQSKFS